MTERDETMTLEKAIKMLEDEYERAKKMDYVRNPIAYALHQVWKMADCESEATRERETERNSQPHYMCNRCGFLFKESQLVHERWYGYCCRNCYDRMHGATIGFNKAPNDGRERCTVCVTPASLFFVGGDTVGARYCPSCYNKKMGYRGGSGI